MSAPGKPRCLSVATCHVINIAFFGSLVTVFVMSPYVRTPPWGFAGWIGVILSTLLWLSSGVIVSVLIGYLASEPEQPMAQMTGETLQGYAMVGGTFLVLTWLLAFCELDATAPVGQDSTLALVEMSDEPVQASIEQWKAKKADLEQTQYSLLADVRSLVQNLHGMGVRSKADLREHPRGLELVEELKEVVSQAKSVKDEIERVELAITRAESRLRRLDRRKLVSEEGVIAEQELEDFSLLQHELEEELRGYDGKRSSLRELELDAFIEALFGQLREVGE